MAKFTIWIALSNLFLISFVRSHGEGKLLLATLLYIPHILIYIVYLDIVCPSGKFFSTTMYVGKGESYSLGFQSSEEKTKCKVIYKPVKDDPTHEECCKTGLRFSCSYFDLPNRNTKSCRRGAKLKTSIRRKP